VSGNFFRTRGGSSLYYEDEGSGTVILALPGIGGGAFFFESLLRRSSSRRRVVCVDLPGTGRSLSSPHAFSLESWIADLGDFISRGIGKPVVILGHSLGTILALHANATWPQLMRAMIFVGGLPKVLPAIRLKLSARAEAVGRGGLVGWGPNVSRGIFAAATIHHRPAMVSEFEKRFEAQDPASYLRSIEILLAADATALVPLVDVRCLALTGSDDTYAPPDLVNDFAARVRGGCRVQILADCGHMPFFEAPESFAEAIESFVDDLGLVEP
jgi:pimeloyl-ACP methyl ester carboxylesterase